jgi:hypothetical protein
MTWILPLLKHRATWGVAVCLGLFASLAVHGRLKYTEGVRDGTASERAAWSSEVALARNSAIASQVAADAATSALRDSVRLRDARIVQLTEAAAMARGNYRAALRAYEAAKKYASDSGHVSDSPVTRACEEVASTCATALAAEGTVKDSLQVQLLTASRLVAVQDSVIRTEPARTTLTVREMLAQQRAAFRGPSRTKWGVTGAVLGAVGAWLVLR